MKLKEIYTSKQGYVYSRTDVLKDYKNACESRQASLLGRKEVLTGKAKFGIFGDGKELPQLAMAKVFRKGDWRSGYYRDQTLMFATGMMNLEEFFAQLYGDTDISVSRGNGGRLMNNHFATRTLDENGKWLNLTTLKNSSADISPTAGQMPRLVGLAYASKLFRNNPNLTKLEKFSINGNEVAFGTIGDASTSEGVFWESINAAGVLQIPMAVSVWDDGFGISVPIDYQTTKKSISDILKGFESEPGRNGYKIFVVKGWDYENLCETYDNAISFCRENHMPVLIHVIELTQPQGHSTSGSHERYKTPEQLDWEKNFDCIKKFKEWILEKKLADDQELELIEKQAVINIKDIRDKAWNHYVDPLENKRDEFLKLVDITTCNCAKTDKIDVIKQDLKKIADPIRKDIMSSARQILRLICNSCSNPDNSLKINVTNWLKDTMDEGFERYSSHLYSESDESAVMVEEVPAVFDHKSALIPGREILRNFWDKVLERDEKVLIFGEDVGKIGGVNQTLEGLQQKYGDLRVIDTGIREATIIGQAVGLAMRGLRPVAEIQYFDYLLYALQVVSDDLATLQYRTKGGQKAPMIISTRGHRLEGVWHSGSALSMVINSIRGVNILVPRNMTQAAGLYNTILKSDEPALLIEPLNAYRLRERTPANLGEFTVPLGQPEILLEGTDVTIVTYGSCVRIAHDAVKQLNEYEISVELIDIQTLIPFDLKNIIQSSIKKTNKVLFFDEDVPGGATAYMMQKVIEDQKAWYYLDAEPKTLSAKAHRPAYSTDGDYFSNPNAEDVFEVVYNIMHEVNPEKFPKIF
jgi:pyruvate/2-oxoglutarate/acetoin dehydrogenase E1 component/TPP-dependent pyruvate/acetoin dehydrogenase alpha subunit